MSARRCQTGAATALLRRYEAIAEHAELELELAGAGRDRWPGRARRALGGAVAGLPAQPPAAAAALLDGRG